MSDNRQGRGGLAVPGEASEAVARVFFALWPDDHARAALARLAERVHGTCGGRMMRASNIHLTLVFIGNVAMRRLPELCELAGGIVAAPFDLTIDAVEYWRHNRIVWAGPRTCPGALHQLVEHLEDVLRNSGFRVDERPYAPHITLVRDARRAPSIPTLPQVHWHLTEFALLRSARRDHTPAYEKIQLWPLGV